MLVFSGRWAAQILDDRGIRHPGWRMIDAALCDIDELTQEAIYSALTKLGFGVEDADDFDRVQAFLALTQRSAVEPMTQPDSVCIKDNLSCFPPIIDSAQKTRQRKASLPEVADVVRRTFHGHGLHIYGGRAALKAELDSPKDSTRWLSRFTISFDVAPAISPRNYDWDVKLSFQLTNRELPVLASFLLGYAGPELAFGNHGPGKDKTLELKDQGSHLFLKLRQAQSAFALPISAPDHYLLSSLVLTAMRLNSPDLDGPLQLAALSKCGAMGLHQANCR